jgi:CBS domain-containing protein
MARYGRDFEGNRTGRGRGFGGDFGFRTRPGRDDLEQGFGGMRSDANGNWRDFEGEEGWFGSASPGYPGGDSPYGQFVDYGREFGGRPSGQSGQGRGRNRGYMGSPRGGSSFESGISRGGRDRYEQSSESNRGGRGDMRASDIMTENPECVTPDTPVSEVAMKMRDLDVGIIPVVDSHEGRRLRGVVTDRDLTIRVLAEGRTDAKVSDCMSDDVETVNKNDSVRNVMSVMQREQIRRVPVTDREGRLVGIIAQADLATDYTNNDHGREHEVENTLEKISEPSRGRGRNR